MQLRISMCRCLQKTSSPMRAKSAFFLLVQIQSAACRHSGQNPKTMAPWSLMIQIYIMNNANLQNCMQTSLPSMLHSMPPSQNKILAKIAT